MQFTVNLETFTVSKGPRDNSWSATCDITAADIADGMAQRIFDYGLKQVIADAASQATNAADATAMMAKKLDAIRNGTWSSRGGGSAVDERTEIARMIVRAELKANYGAKSPEWADFTGLSDEAQNEKLDYNFAENEDVFGPIVDAEIARRVEKAKDRQALRGKVKFAL